MLTPVLTHDLESVKKIVLEQLKAHGAKVYLFGSQATGKARLYSDIDVAILPLQPLPVLALSEIREKLEESAQARAAHWSAAKFKEELLKIYGEKG